MKKVTEEELQQIQQLREALVEIVTQIGELHLSEFMAKRQLDQVQQNVKAHEQKFVEFQEKERVLFEQLQQKYGDGNINMDTGEITE